MVITITATLVCNKRGLCPNVRVQNVPCTRLDKRRQGSVPVPWEFHTLRLREKSRAELSHARYDRRTGPKRGHVTYQCCPHPQRRTTVRKMIHTCRWCFGWRSGCLFSEKCNIIGVRANCFSGEPSCPKTLSTAPKTANLIWQINMLPANINPIIINITDISQFILTSGYGN